MESLLILFFVIIVIACCLGILVLAFKLLKMIFVGAILLLAFASEQGFLGIAAYLACWVFLFPVMVIICGVIGFLLSKELWGI